MRRLVVNYYVDPDSARRAELEACLRANCECPQVDEVCAVVTPTDAPVLRSSPPGKLSVYCLDGRPQFADLFAVADRLAGPQDITVLANNDIRFDDTLRFADVLRPREVFALLRYEANGKLHTDPHGVPSPGSQDTWMWRGKLAVPDTVGRYWMGVLGCDNRLAFELAAAGYRVSNPCLSIRTWHMHDSKVRRSSVDRSARLPRPYRLVPINRVDQSRARLLTAK